MIHTCATDMLRFGRRVSAGVLLALSLFAASVAHAQDGPPPVVRETIQALVAALEAPDSAAIARFVAERVAPAYRARAGEPALLERLRTVRESLGGTVNDLSVMRTPDGLLLEMSGRAEVALPLTLDDAGLVTAFGDPVARPEGGGGPTLWDGTTWETLADRLRQVEADGFSGVVLARRSGTQALRSAFGLADPATQRRTALETVYGIGSTPIDFTITGIMLLGQRGRLVLDDSITRFVDDVPADKRGITIRHLLTGRSGLPDFVDEPARDWNPDLAWIDRETLERRVLTRPLLFAPGTERRHSHAAFGLLAAIIERVDGRSYREFVRAEILQPVGMPRTGFYGETRGLELADFAVGPGPSIVGVPNIPPNWGPTSWLVMGSGGMFSTLDDMQRYYDAIDAGQLLEGEWAKWQQGASADAGGSDQGFFIFRTTNGRGSSILVLMNGEGRSAATRAMTRTFERLVGAP